MDRHDIQKTSRKKDFQVKDTTSPQMMAKITECANIYRGTPYWVDAENRIKTINFAKSVCSETARLVTLGIKIQIDGGARGGVVTGSRLTRHILICATG